MDKYNACITNLLLFLPCLFGALWKLLLVSWDLEKLLICFKSGFSIPSSIPSLWASALMQNWTSNTNTGGNMVIKWTGEKKNYKLWVTLSLQHYCYIVSHMVGANANW